MAQTTYHALREPLPPPTEFGAGDILVLFGEVFSRGYANGLIQEAEARGMTIIRTTVGRRSSPTENQGELRPLNAEELAQTPSPLINIPLEAGFDLEKADGETPFIQILKSVRPTDWEEFKLDRSLLEKARLMGRNRFQSSVREAFRELHKLIPENRNVYFAHLMAGGVPRTRVVMPIMNRIFKGVGERHLSSQKLWESDLGIILQESFLEVSAETFDVLIRESEELRKRQQKSGKRVVYSAYGYHGTEVLLKSQYHWQSYAPYLQGWAKIRLEDISKEWNQKGVHCAVYNCPEILTNSSSIFQGVEVPLYPLLRAIQKENPTLAAVQSLRTHCQNLLKPGESLDQILDLCEETLLSPEIRAQSLREQWPQHNSQAQAERLLVASDLIFERHLSTKNLMTIPLSEIVFSACGRLMLADLGAVSGPAAPVSWINHDVVARCFPNLHLSNQFIQ